MFLLIFLLGTSTVFGHQEFDHMLSNIISLSSMRILKKYQKDILRILFHPFNMEASDVANNFLKDISDTSVLNLQQCELNTSIGYFNDLVIIVSNVFELYMLLKESCVDMYRHPNVVIVMVLATNCYKGCILEMAKLCWKYSFLNAFIVTIRSIDNGVQVFSYSPYTSVAMCDQVNLVALSDDIYNSSTSINLDINHSDIINMNKCPLSIVSTPKPPFMYCAVENGNIVPLQGIELNILRCLAKVINFSIDFIFIPSDWDSSVRKLHEGGSMISSPYYSTDKRYKNMTFTFYYSSESRIVLPLSKKMNNFQKIFKPFSISAWYIILGVSLLIWLTCGVIKYILKKWNHKGVVFIITTLDIFGSILGVSVPVIMKQFSSKTFFIFILFFTFLLRNVYLAMMFKYIVSDIYETNLNTLDEVLKTDMPIGGDPNDRAYFDIDGSNYKRFVSLNTTGKNLKLKNISNGENFALIMPQLFLASSLAVYNISPASVYEADEILSTLPFCAVYLKNSPFVKKFSTVIGKLIDNGLIYKWISDSESGISPSKKGLIDDPVVMQWEHLAGSFKILGFGSVLATLVLFMEIIYAARLRICTSIFNAVTHYL